MLLNSWSIVYQVPKLSKYFLGARVPSRFCVTCNSKSKKYIYHYGSPLNYSPFFTWTTMHLVYPLNFAEPLPSISLWTTVISRKNWKQNAKFWGANKVHKLWSVKTVSIVTEIAFLEVMKTVFATQENWISGLIHKKRWADLFPSLLEFFIQRSFCATLGECAFILLKFAQKRRRRVLILALKINCLKKIQHVNGSNSNTKYGISWEWILCREHLVLLTY